MSIHSNAVLFKKSGIKYLSSLKPGICQMCIFSALMCPKPTWKHQQLICHLMHMNFAHASLERLWAKGKFAGTDCNIPLAIDSSSWKALLTDSSLRGLAEAQISSYYIGLPIPCTYTGSWSVKMSWSKNSMTTTGILVERLLSSTRQMKYNFFSHRT